MAVRSADGETLYKNTKAVWVAALKDKDNCKQLVMGWKQWAIDNDFFRAWENKIKKIRKRSKDNEDEGDNVDEDPGVVDICLPGEDEYVNIWGDDSALNDDLGRDGESEHVMGEGLGEDGSGEEGIGTEGGKTVSMRDRKMKRLRRRSQQRHSVGGRYDRRRARWRR